MAESNIPIERTKEITNVLITSENARILQKSIIIVNIPSDVLRVTI